ncbi:MAG: transglutaminase domain-containing protein [Candidatus Marinimicrobia bacterium]|nr:transglutaminase domain-containing protein [Candidatus Neomarinimicrobiota bacterium]
MKRRLYLILLVTLWVALSGRLVYNRYFQGGSTAYLSLETGLRELPSESEWMNIYLDGRKMGHTVYSIENKGSAGYSIKSSTHLNVVFGGLESEIHLENKAVMDTMFRLNGFSFWMNSDQYSTYIVGDKEGTEMSLSIIQGRDTSYSKIEVPEDLYTYTAIQPMVASKGILEGETIRVPAYDPMSNEMADVTISHEGKELQKIAGEKLILNKLRIEFKGIPSIMWLDDNGITYKEETIMGMTMERTTPELALSRIESAEVDLLNGFAVVPTHPIYRPGRLNELILEIEGIPVEVLSGLNSERQKLINIDPVKLRLTPTSTMVAPKTIQSYLRPSEMIQSEHAQIKEQVSKILKQKSPTQNVGKVFTKWVFEYLEKRPVASISGAVDILNTGVGDCTEHTTLYTALSRAAGIPTKVHIGLVYVQGRFLFHAWPVIAIDGEWVDVDPSLNQYPADVTHIALLEGDFENLTNLIPLLGNIKIKVQEQRY